jgi:hypothetical protein
MINLGYGLSIKDAEELKKFKGGISYGNYLKSISMSPAFKLIMKEHIDGVDISEDIKTLKNQGKLPDAVNPQAMSDLFKQALSKMAICLVADSIILKELEDVKIEEILSNLNSETEINYLMGKADKIYYEQALKLYEQNKLKEDSVAYRGLLRYYKQNGKFSSLKKDTLKEHKIQPIIEHKTQSTIEPKHKTDLESDDITL